MQAITNEILEKRIKAINLLAENINELYEEEALTVKQKYHDTISFVNEMIRNASGLADLEEEAMMYGYWE